jgi:RNase P subunit RPR2
MQLNDKIGIVKEKQSAKNLDCLSRMNYLLQAAHFMSLLAIQKLKNGPNSTLQIPSDVVCQSPILNLSRQYIKHVKIISEKSVQRMYESILSFLYLIFVDREPQVKRILCKTCNQLLLPGITSKLSRVCHKKGNIHD